MRVALVQVNLTYAIYTWQHMATYIDIWLYVQQIGLTNFVLHCSCFGYWGLLRCSLPPQPRCCASSGWTSCQPYQEPNYTCWSQAMNTSDGGSLNFVALMCLLWHQWVWAPCPCNKSEWGQEVQHRLMVRLDVMRHVTMVLCNQTWRISWGSLLPSCASHAHCVELLRPSKSSYAGVSSLVEYGSLQALMYAMYCHRCDEIRLSCSFVLCWIYLHFGICETICNKIIIDDLSTLEWNASFSVMITHHTELTSTILSCFLFVLIKALIFTLTWSCAM